MGDLWQRLAREASQPPTDRSEVAIRGLRCPRCGTYCPTCTAVPDGWDELPERPEHLNRRAMRRALIQLDPPTEVLGRRLTRRLRL